MAKGSRSTTRMEGLLRQCPVDSSQWSLKSYSTPTSSWNGRPWWTKRIGVSLFRILCHHSNFLSTATNLANLSTKTFRWAYRSCRVDRCRLSQPCLHRCLITTPLAVCRLLCLVLLSRVQEEVEMPVVLEEDYKTKQPSIPRPMSKTFWKFRNTWVSMGCLRLLMGGITRFMTQMLTRTCSTGRNMKVSFKRILTANTSCDSTWAMPWFKVQLIVSKRWIWLNRTTSWGRMLGNLKKTLT